MDSRGQTPKSPSDEDSELRIHNIGRILLKKIRPMFKSRFLIPIRKNRHLTTLALRRTRVGEFATARLHRHVAGEYSGELMSKIVHVIMACSMLIGFAGSALAHHSAAAFDTQQEIKVSGTVTVYKFRNPHVYMSLQLKKADGSTSLMEVEAGAASVLSPLGFTKDSVAVGDGVTSTGNPGGSHPDKMMLRKGPEQPPRAR